MDLAPYDAQQTNIDTAWANAKSQIANQRTQLGTQYGGTFDSGGHFSIDNASPYGAVQSLRNNQGLDLANNAESQHSRGLGTPGYGLAGQREQLMQYGDRQQQFDLLNQAQQSYLGTVSNEQSAKTQHDLSTTSLGIDKANQLAAEEAWDPAASPAVPGSATAPIPGIGTSTSSYLPASVIAAAAAKSGKSVKGKPGNSGIHAM